MLTRALDTDSELLTSPEIFISPEKANLKSKILTSSEINSYNNEQMHLKQLNIAQCNIATFLSYGHLCVTVNHVRLMYRVRNAHGLKHQRRETDNNHTKC
jgi:hypothetical protein